MQQEILKRLRQNIQTKQRPNTLLEIANDIQWLKDNYGSTVEIAKELEISSGMINTFLSARKVAPQVQQMIKDRQIDSVFAVHALKSFSESDQLILVQALSTGRFSSQQARALVPLKNIFPEESISLLMEVIRQTKNSKQYVNHFPMPDENGLQIIRHRIQMASQGKAFSLSNIENIGVFTISKSGVKKMREDAARKKIGFHSYLLALFNPESDFEKGLGEMMK